MVSDERFAPHYPSDVSKIISAMHGKEAAQRHFCVAFLA